MTGYCSNISDFFYLDIVTVLLHNYLSSTVATADQRTSLQHPCHISRWWWNREKENSVVKTNQSEKSQL